MFRELFEAKPFLLEIEAIRELDNVLTEEEIAEVLGFAIKQEDRYFVFKKIRGESDKIKNEGLAFILDVKDIVINLIKKCKDCNKKVLIAVSNTIKDLIRTGSSEDLKKESILHSIEQAIAIA